MKHHNLFVTSIDLSCTGGRRGLGVWPPNINSVSSSNCDLLSLHFNKILIGVESTNLRNFKIIVLFKIGASEENVCLVPCTDTLVKTCALCF